ncbi:pyruvate kinase [Streptomyces sp. NPDC059582]|uniref:pyruvate kinase n=1 Tax=Streptomyces sp. NPDC059582 TaxID=3346875 RepID=UPI0036CFF0B5
MTSLIATMGPAILSPRTLHDAIARGVSALRFSASKFSAGELAAQAQRTAGIGAALGRPLDLLLDLPGAKTRLTNEDFFPLAGVERLHVLFHPAPARPELPVAQIGTTGMAIAPYIEPGDILVLGDGENALRVESRTADGCMTRPLTHGDVGRHKGISLHGKPQAYQALGDAEAIALKGLGESVFSGVIVSFVEDPDTLEQARSLIGDTPHDGRPAPALIAKIETRAGAERAAELARAADGVLLGRGDLLLDAGELDFYDLGKTVMKETQKAGRPLMVGTQLLASLSEGWLPNRSELAYLSHLVEKEVDGLMLATETTVGSAPLRTVELVTALIERYGTGAAPAPLFPSRSAA